MYYVRRLRKVLTEVVLTGQPYCGPSSRHCPCICNVQTPHACINVPMASVVGTWATCQASFLLRLPFPKPSPMHINCRQPEIQTWKCVGPHLTLRLPEPPSNPCASFFCTLMPSKEAIIENNYEEVVM